MVSACTFHWGSNRSCNMQLSDYNFASVKAHYFHSGKFSLRKVADTNFPSKKLKIFNF